MKIKDKPQNVLRKLFGSMKFGNSGKLLSEIRKESKADFKNVKLKKFKGLKNVEFKK